MSWVPKAISQITDPTSIILFILSLVISLIIFLIRRSWISHQPSRVNVFDIIDDPRKLLKHIYNPSDDSPLADQNIPYQARDSDRDIHTELHNRLHKSRPYLLITARTGSGKTREAAILAQSLMAEDYCVLYIRPGWLDIPTELPPRLIAHHGKVLVFLDDLNKLFRYGQTVKHPRTADELLLAKTSYHDRLLRFLDHLETIFPQNVRVIATARDEGTEWRILDFDPSDNLWVRFDRYRLPEPMDNAMIAWLENVIKVSELSADVADFPKIIRMNQGGYRNLAQNVRRLQHSNEKLNASTFIPTAYGSWREIYLMAVGRHPSVQPIFDSIEMLRQCGIEPLRPLVEQAALIIWSGNHLQSFLQRRAIRSGLNYLIDELQILPQRGDSISPYDGQIEAKETRYGWQPHIPQLTSLILKRAEFYGLHLSQSLLNFADTLFINGFIAQSKEIRLKLIQMYPTQPLILLSVGVVDQILGQYKDAEAIYRQVIEKDPNIGQAFHNLAVLLGEQGRVKEAEATYRQAIEKSPTLTPAYYNLGMLLESQGRTKDAEDVYRQAFQKDPNSYQAYFSLGALLGKQGQLEEAEDVFRLLIGKYPNLSLAYWGLGKALDEKGHSKEAENAYRQAIQKNP